MRIRMETAANGSMCPCGIARTSETWRHWSVAACAKPPGSELVRGCGDDGDYADGWGCASATVARRFATHHFDFYSFVAICAAYVDVYVSVNATA